ncbi:MAG: PilZ domain-containing protein [Deltaproteobacteria bacterium]|nr:PilZ domain-containing protein [Deltaproteobacteria bacterium]
MNQLRIENMVINYDGQQITFDDRDRQKYSFKLKPDTISDLIDYLRSFQKNDGQKRNAFRIPLTEDNGLSVVLKYGDKSCAVTPINISLTGILIEFDSDDVYDMALNEEVVLSIKLGQKAGDILGGIVRRDNRQYGIFFLGTVDGNKIQPPEIISYIALKLERAWLRSRIQR